MIEEFKYTMARQKKKAFSLGYSYALFGLCNVIGHVMLGNLCVSCFSGVTALNKDIGIFENVN
jgi:hypothetical protein|tara:strand:+ start:494 stop:682 length:189 start_codon:yes stop_codon:yes gene_type:complete